MTDLLDPDEKTAGRTTHLLSRYACSILWLARYIERIENVARIIDVTKSFSRGDFDQTHWLSIVRINSDEKPFYAKHAAASVRNVAHFYLLDRDNPTSVPCAIEAVRENARTLRALISTEMWLQINVMYGQIRALTEADIAPGELFRICAMLKEGCQSHTGITEGTFYRDESACFYWIGRHLERADQTTRLLDIKFNTLLPSSRGAGAEVEAGQWNALLRAAAGYHAFRRVHPRDFSVPDVVAFLLLDGSFPRSVGLNIAQLEWQISRLRARHGLVGGRAALERTDTLRAMLSEQTIADILARGLSPFLDWVQGELARLHGDIAAAFFPG